MGFVVHRGRRQEPARRWRVHAGRRRVSECVPYLFAALGLVLALPALAASWAALSGNSPDWWVALIYWLPPAASLMLGRSWRRRHGARGSRRRIGARGVGSGLGREKQLLLAMESRGGSISPIGAALVETSLTVDEAEGILSRLAGRGHLFVESRDGALFYRMPGEHGAPPGPRQPPGA